MTRSKTIQTRLDYVLHLPAESKTTSFQGTQPNFELYLPVESETLHVPHYKVLSQIMCSVFQLSQQELGCKQSFQYTPYNIIFNMSATYMHIKRIH